jgi:hypothetical protein
MRTAALALMCLTLQRMLGVPGMPAWSSAILIPAVLGVGRPMLGIAGRDFWFGLALGLGWDVVMEPVVGPGGIYWSASTLLVAWVIRFIADRSPLAWFGIGALVAMLVSLLRHAVLLTLGISDGLWWYGLARGALLTGALCGAVAWVLVLDLPARWLEYRRRRLR